jgi:hypothetical protein
MSATMPTRYRHLLLGVILAFGLVHLHPAIGQQQDAGQLFFDGFDLLNKGKAKEAAAKFEAASSANAKNAR